MIARVITGLQPSELHQYQTLQEEAEVADEVRKAEEERLKNSSFLNIRCITAPVDVNLPPISTILADTLV